MGNECFSLLKKDGHVSLFSKIMAGLTSGAIGSFLANPTDLVKIRQQGEAGLLKNGIYVTGLQKGTIDCFFTSKHIN